MSPHDGRVDHLDAVLPLAAVVESSQQHVPNPRQRPAPELLEIVPSCRSGRAGRAKASLSARSRIHHPTPGDDPAAGGHAAAPSRSRTARSPPLLAPQQTTNQSRPPQRAALNQQSVDSGIHFINRTWAWPLGKGHPRRQGQRHADIESHRCRNHHSDACDRSVKHARAKFGADQP